MKGMERAAIIIHTAGRQPMLPKTLVAIRETEALRGWPVFLVAQGYDRAAADALKKLEGAEVLQDVLFMPELTGPFSARAAGLRRFQAEVTLNLDDDITILPETTYEPCVAALANEDLGIVHATAAATPQKVRDAMAKNAGRGLEPRIIVWTGGGMLVRGDLASLIIKHPDKRYFDDNAEWSLISYTNGYMNAEHFGCWAAHAAGKPRGIVDFYRSKARKVPVDPSLATTRQRAPTGAMAEGCDVTTWVWPLRDSDVTERAHAMHKTALGLRRTA